MTTDNIIKDAPLVAMVTAPDLKLKHGDYS